jgi:hypothetical protein
LGRGGVRLLTSATVSRLANAAAEVAIVLLVIACTHDSRLAGLVVAAFALPTLPMPASRQPAQTGSLAAAIGDGLRLLWRVPLLRSTTATTTLGQFT